MHRGLIRRVGGESVESLKQLIGGHAGLFVRNTRKGLIQIRADQDNISATPAIGSRLSVNKADCIVTSVDKREIYAAHINGPIPNTGDAAVPIPTKDTLLGLPKWSRQGQVLESYWHSGHYLTDLTRMLRKGHVCSIVGANGKGKSSIAASLCSENTVVVCADSSGRRYAGVSGERIIVDPNHWAASQHAWLAPLRGLHRALDLCKEKSDVRLIIDDLGMLHQLNREAQRSFFSVAQMVSAISAYAGVTPKGHLSVAFVVDGSPYDQIWKVAESVSDVCLNHDDKFACRSLWPLGISNLSGSSSDLLARVGNDLFAKLRESEQKSEQIEMLQDLKMHIDFWDREEVDSTRTALLILNKFGNSSSKNHVKELLTLARACTLYHFPKLEIQEADAFTKSLLQCADEDDFFNQDLNLELLDRSLLQWKHRFECLDPCRFF